MKDLMVTERLSSGPFDAVLLIGFGGPQGREDIRPFLQNVLRARRIPPARFEAVVQHYELFDGVSPLTEITMRQAAGLRTRLAADGLQLPVYVGMRNWHPFLDDTLSEMALAGVQHNLGIILAAQHCYSSCGQYKQNVSQALSEPRNQKTAELKVTYVAGWHDHQGFVAANAECIRDALDTLPAALRQEARLVFTAHSIPQAMARVSRYEEELRESAALVAQHVGCKDWALAFQSRSGRPGDPWLEPDICDYLRAEVKTGLKSVMSSPIGFVCDHVEVLYDLDIEAAEACRDLGLPMRRAASVGEHPMFLDMLADVVRQAHRRYGRGRPLPLVPANLPLPLELPPPAR